MGRGGLRLHQFSFLRPRAALNLTALTPEFSIGQGGINVGTIRRHAKDIRKIHPGESDPDERFDSILISWVKKSD
jgi:hypothetical protein